MAVDNLLDVAPDACEPLPEPETHGEQSGHPDGNSGKVLTVVEKVLVLPIVCLQTRSPNFDRGFSLSDQHRHRNTIPCFLNPTTSAATLMTSQVGYPWK